jgi:hypothetical protein
VSCEQGLTAAPAATPALAQPTHRGHEAAPQAAPQCVAVRGSEQQQLDRLVGQPKHDRDDGDGLPWMAPNTAARSEPRTGAGGDNGIVHDD